MTHLLLFSTVRYVTILRISKNLN